jgi:hypothetical protein
MQRNWAGWWHGHWADIIALAVIALAAITVPVR